jgi:hypothetical protein
METASTSRRTTAEALVALEADPLENAIAALVRESHDAELRRRVDDSMDRQLARFRSGRTRDQSLVAA